MNYFLLFDNKCTDKEFISEQIGVPINVYYSPENSNKLISWIQGVIKVLTASERNDTIIFWYDFQAIICWWLCHLLFMHRNVICINVLLKDKKTFKNKIVSYLYKKALMSSDFRASVTSRKYGDWLNKKLGIDVMYDLIHDVYHDDYEFSQYVEPVPNSVFCGGNNGRDWNLIIEVARLLPNIQFNIVMPHNVYLKYRSCFTENMNVRYGISYNEFMKELCSSTIVCLPLDTEAPAGLIVMFQAAANLKMIVTTDTVTTSEYISIERGDVLGNDVSEWQRNIMHYLNNTDESFEKAKALKEYLKENASESRFIKGLKNMLS